MEINNKINIHNRFDIEVRDKNTGELKQKAVAYNIVLNQMYTRLCGGLSYFANIHFGSGTGTLSASRTSLFSHLGTKAAADEQIIKAIPLSTWKRKIVLNPEEYVGNTISEVGIAFGATNTNLVTHSLLKDSEGNPISIVKTDVDVITIYATVFVTFDNSNPNLVYINMPSGNTLVNYLIGGGTAPTGAFSLTDIFFSSKKLGSTSNVTWTSDTVNKQRKTNALRFGTTVGNGQVKFLEFENLFSLEFPYSSVFNGQSYESVNVGVGDGLTRSFNLPSANIKSESLVVKRNGIVDNGFSLKSFNVSSFGRCATSVYINTNCRKVSISDDGKKIFLLSGYSPWFNFAEYVDGVYKGGELLSFGVSGYYGSCVSISGNGLVIGQGQAQTNLPSFCDYVDGSWVLRPVISLSGNITDMSMSYNGMVVALARATSSYVYVYEYNGVSWVSRSITSGATTELSKIDISSDGNVVAFFQNAAPYVRVFDWDGSNYVARPNINGITSISSGDLSSDGTRVVFGGNAGNGFVYLWNGVSWVLELQTVEVMSGSVIKIVENGTRMLMSTSSTSTVEYHLENDVWVKSSYVASYDSTISSSSSFSEDGSCFIYGNGILSPYIFVNGKTKMNSIVFNTPPAIGDVISADYTVDGIHKTDQYVIDASFAIQFGEGV